LFLAVAPIAAMAQAEFDVEEPVVIEWAEGDDLGECDFGDLIPDPGSVEEAAWEAVVEDDT